MSAPTLPPPSPLYIGIDFGTSACRAMAIDARQQLIASASVALPPAAAQADARQQDPELWWVALQEVLAELLKRTPARQVAALAIDGTSGTLLLTDAAGRPLADALLYHDQRATDSIALLRTVAPPDSPVLNPASGLAKLLWLAHHQPQPQAIAHALHQADWLAGCLTGRFGISDVNNSLKTGYDPVQGVWPAWLDGLPLQRRWLPRVQQPGELVGRLLPELAKRFGLPAETRVVSGTTDSTASFLATGASQPGDAVSVLGSTLVLKILSEQPVYAAEYGVYSQPLGTLWLCGGASNSGGAVLHQFFTPQQMQALTPLLQPAQPTGLDYYPLPGQGERFPVNDPQIAPRLTPRPPQDSVFFQGLLEGIARIEQQGYARLAQLGAPSPRRVFSAGGGSVNPAWTRIRQGMLGVDVLTAAQTEAAYGSALLALRSHYTS